MAHAVTSFVDSYRVLAVLVLMPFGGALAAPAKVAIVLGAGLVGAVARWLYRGRTAAAEEGGAR
jgi:flagellar biosynthesis protein FliR